MDEGVDTIDPVEECRPLEEPLLEAYLPEDVELLLEMDELESMLAGDIDGALNKCEGCECPTQLVNLRWISDSRKPYLQSAYPVDEGPVPCLSKEGKPLENTAQEAVLEDECVRGGDDALVAEEVNLASTECRLFLSEEFGR
jgi:hypothetical protein